MPKRDESSSLTKDGLARLRNRLLDLTNRNKLLNYQHRGKACLRVVDELPDELFARLIDEKPLAFQPVPEPKPIDFEPETSKGAVPH